MNQGLKATILVKVESLNPGGSVKDRGAVKMSWCGFPSASRTKRT